MINSVPQLRASFFGLTWVTPHLRNFIAPFITDSQPHTLYTEIWSTMRSR